MRQVNRSSKRNESSTMGLPRKARLDCNSSPHLIRSDRQASSLHPTCCRGNSLTDKVTHLRGRPKRGGADEKFRARALPQAPPRLGSTVAILACLLSNIERKQTVGFRIR